MENLNIGSEDFNLDDSVLQGYDLSGMVASLDPSYLEDIGVRGLLNTTSLLTDLDVAGDWETKTALNVLDIVGAGSAVTLKALEGIASALGEDGAGQLDDDVLLTVVQNLDFDAKNASALLGDFSVGALDSIDLGSLVQLELEDIAGLINSGREIFEVGEENLAAAVEALLGNNGLDLMDPSAFGSAIAGLSGDMISAIFSDGSDAATALDTVGADRLDSQGANFGEIIAGQTTFDLIADLVETILVDGEEVKASLVADGKRLRAEVLLVIKNRIKVRTPDGGAVSAVRG